MEGKENKSVLKKNNTKGRKILINSFCGGARFKDVVMKSQTKSLGIQKKSGTQRATKKGGISGSEGMSSSTFFGSCANKVWKNCLLDNGNPAVIANEVWNFGKTVGLGFNGDKSSVVRRLESMEVRDRREAGRVEEARASS